MATNPTQVSIYPPIELREEFKSMAKDEKRTEAQMIVILAEEGLRARTKETVRG